MRLWRRTSTEMAGAWRSLRYDMGRRPSEPPAGGPDVTSTGMNTFGGTAWGYEPAPPVRTRPARGAALVSAFGLLTVLGATAAYLVVVNGLVPMRDEKPAAAGTLPAVAPTVTAQSGLGPSVRLPRRHTPAETVPAPGAAKAPVAAVPSATTSRPVRTVRPTSQDCLCGNPPVPTPTAPASAPSPTPSAPASPSNSPNASPSGGGPGTPSESPEPGSSWKARHHRHSR